MTDDQRNARNKEMISQLSHWMQPKVAAVLVDLTAHGYRPRIQCAWRNPVDQLKAYHSGHSKLRFGLHCVTLKGQPSAWAADILDDSTPLNPSTAFLLTLAASAQAHGLETGIRWGLPTKLRSAIDAAIATHSWNAPVKIGWDANHVQVKALTATQAQRGIVPR